MNVQSIKLPEHAGSREQARALTQPLVAPLSDHTIVLDFSAVLVCTPSFLDELVKQILEQRGASTVEVLGASARARELLARAAANRDVSDRLVFQAAPV